MPPPQNNQLQELPYNELSRLSDLRTLNLHNNLISSEGEGEHRRLPSLAWPQQPSPSPMLGLWAALRQFPELPFAEQDGNSGDGGGEGGAVAFVDWEGVPGGASASPRPGALGQPGAQAPPAPYPLPGLGSPQYPLRSQACPTRPLSPSPSCSISTWPTTR